MSREKKMTLDEFRRRHNRSGDSVMSIAFEAQNVSDDPQFVALAKAAIDAEDHFLAAMIERGIEIG